MKRSKYITYLFSLIFRRKFFSNNFDELTECLQLKIRVGIRELQNTTGNDISRQELDQVQFSDESYASHCTNFHPIAQALIFKPQFLLFPFVLLLYKLKVLSLLYVFPLSQSDIKSTSKENQGEIKDKMPEVRLGPV